ncbi:LOW QUALITY PROTEIN: hypothetical protein T265_15865, partial [Opisthorchis viverrini]
LNRKAIYNLKKDAGDKLSAQHIDEYALSLKSTDESLPGLKSGTLIDPNLKKWPVGPHSSSFTTEEWQHFSHNTIQAGDKQLQNSQQLRSIIDGILQQIASDQKRQVEATNRALKKRITETRDAKGKLEEHLS